MCCCKTVYQNQSEQNGCVVTGQDNPLNGRITDPLFQMIHRNPSFFYLPAVARRLLSSLEYFKNSLVGGTDDAQ